MITLILSVLCYTPLVWINWPLHPMQCSYSEIFLCLFPMLDFQCYVSCVFFFLSLLCSLVEYLIEEVGMGVKFFEILCLWKCHYSSLILGCRIKGWKTFLFKCWSQFSIVFLFPVYVLRIQSYPDSWFFVANLVFFFFLEVDEIFSVCLLILGLILFVFSFWNSYY